MRNLLFSLIVWIGLAAPLPAVEADNPDLDGATSRATAAVARPAGNPDAYTGDGPMVALTPEERAWIAAHPQILVGFTLGFPPAVVVDKDGRLDGILPAFLRLLNQRLGTTLHLVLGDWKEIVDRAQRREIDMLGLSNRGTTHRAHFDFTDPLLHVYFYLYARTDEPAPIDGLEALASKRLGYLESSRIVEDVRDRHPEIDWVPILNQEQMIAALLASRVDALIGTASLEYFRVQQTYTGVRISALLPGIGGDVVMSVRNDWPQLTAILNKGLASITPAERQAILGLWLGQDAMARLKGTEVALTRAERDWLRDHRTIRVGIDPAWAPVEFYDEAGRPQGISVGYLERIGEALDLRFEFAQGLSWSEAHRRLEQGALDLLPAMAKTPERARQFQFTESYLSFPVAIFSDVDAAYLGGIEALRGERVAVVKDYAIEAWLRRDYPQLELLPVANAADALRRIARGDAYAFVGNLVTTSYYIGQTGLAQIRVAGETPYRVRLGMAVRKDWGPLAGILQKALDAIPKSERDAIVHRWISIHYRHSRDYTLLWSVLAVAVAVVLLIGYWNRRLVREVAQRRRAEGAMQEAQKEAQRSSRAKSEFLAKMSHDLRTPLTSVLGFSGLLLAREQDPEKRSYAQAIHQGGESLRQLMDDILDLSRIEAGRIELQPGPVETKGLLEELRTLFDLRCAGKQLDLRLVSEASVPETLALDPVRMRQILVNLVDNGIKFTERGHIAVRVSARPVDAKHVCLEVSVEDTGIGIPLDQQQHIFGLFDQAQGQDAARYGGSGLGLAIARRLARLMGGDIQVDSEPGVGSTFRLVLPHVLQAEPVQSSMQQGGSDGELPRFAPAKVLIVDDVPPNRRLLLRYLHGLGLDLSEAEDGQQALDQVRRNHPDLILMDIGLPGMDGLEVTRRLKGDPETARIPVIAVTAAVTPERKREIEAVCDAFVGKPISRRRLLEVVSEVLADR